MADLRARKGERAGREVLGRMKHLLPVLGTRQWPSLTAADLTAWRNGLVEQTVTRTRSGAHATRPTGCWPCARAALNLAFNTGKVADDRAWRRVKAVPRRRRGAQGDPERGRDPAPARRLRAGLRELVLLGALTGARLGELTAARVRDFDADSGDA